MARPEIGGQRQVIEDGDHGHGEVRRKRRRLIEGCDENVRDIRVNASWLAGADALGYRVCVRYWDNKGQQTLERVPHHVGRSGLLNLRRTMRH